MPKRPSSHALGDKAHNRIRQIFIDADWTVSEIHPDYGEDLFVRIFNKGLSRPLYFFVQSKGCEDITDYLIRGGTIVSYPVSTDHIEDWKHFLEPVILTVWDSKTKIAYWQIVQDALEGYDQLKKQGEFHIHIPVENRLNEEGVRRIAVRTLQRFGRFNREEEIANVAMDYLEKRFNIKIDYDADGGVLTVEDDKELVLLFCGEALDMIACGVGIEGLSEEILSDPIRMSNYALKALEESIELDRKLYEKDQLKGCFYVKDLEGNILWTFKTFEELWKAQSKVLELSEYSRKF